MIPSAGKDNNKKKIVKHDPKNVHIVKQINALSMKEPLETVGDNLFNLFPPVDLDDEDLLLAENEPQNEAFRAGYFICILSPAKVVTNIYQNFILEYERMSREHIDLARENNRQDEEIRRLRRELEKKAVNTKPPAGRPHGSQDTGAKPKSTSFTLNEEPMDGVDEDQFEVPVTMVLRPSAYPAAIIDDDCKLRVETVLNKIIRDGRGIFSLKGVTIDSCKFGTMLMKCTNQTVAELLIDTVASVNWISKNLPELTCSGIEGFEPAPVLELWVPEKDVTFDYVKIESLSATGPTAAWRLIKANERLRRGKSFVFVCDKNLHDRIKEQKIIRFDFGLHSAKAVLREPMGYTAKASKQMISSSVSHILTNFSFKLKATRTMHSTMERASFEPSLLVTKPVSVNEQAISSSNNHFKSIFVLCKASPLRSHFLNHSELLYIFILNFLIPNLPVCLKGKCLKKISLKEKSPCLEFFIMNKSPEFLYTCKHKLVREKEINFKIFIWNHLNFILTVESHFNHIVIHRLNHFKTAEVLWNRILNLLCLVDLKCVHNVNTSLNSRSNSSNLLRLFVFDNG